MKTYFKNTQLNLWSWFGTDRIIIPSVIPNNIFNYLNKEDDGETREWKGGFQNIRAI